MQSQPIQIRRGIFQGDSFWPLLFCIALIPLTKELNRAGCGYQVHGTERKIIHRSTERNKKNEGQHSGENKRKMAREEDAWTIAT